jgi:hypothetical protein
MTFKSSKSKKRQRTSSYQKISDNSSNLKDSSINESNNQQTTSSSASLKLKQSGSSANLLTRSASSTNALSSSTNRFSNEKSSSSNKTGTSTNQSSSVLNKPAELYRLDFITAMKLPDTELLDESSYWVIRDQWKIDYEKGVQVPVKDDFKKPNFQFKQDQFSYQNNKTKNEDKIQSVQQEIKKEEADSTPAAASTSVEPQTSASAKATETIIKMPQKYLCPVNDSLFNSQIHQAYVTHGISTSSLNHNPNKICKYDCDYMDLLWLKRVNIELESIDYDKLTRANLENLIENFELQSYHNIKLKLDKLNSYSLEFDQDTVCDVCRQPDSEEDNEMVILFYYFNEKNKFIQTCLNINC